MPKSRYAIRKVAILGSGTMGSQIAAHCVNAGLDVLLLDLKNQGDNPNKTVEENIAKLGKMTPAPLAIQRYGDHIKPGNFEDDFHKIEGADWVCEAIVEKMDIKKKMMARIDNIRTETMIVSSNTSGLPIGNISEDCSDGFQKHFLGTHFFNPPRYMKLLEVIPSRHTSDEVIDYMQRFCEKTLGKGVVRCKDTPNFIANRIGVFSMASIMPYFFDGTFRAEEIDFLTGTLTGYSKAATFRTADMAGLDVIGHVAENIYPVIPDDERRDVFQLPETFKKMVEAGKYGNKAGEGFYKKVQTNGGKEYKVINPDTLEYETQVEPDFTSALKAKKKFGSAAERLNYLVQQNDKAGEFIWNIQRDLLLYSANRVPEISNSIFAIDRAMKWGFNWELGPFERWDAIGVRKSVERMKSDGLEVPDSVKAMLDAGRDSFYDLENRTVYNLVNEEIEPLSAPAKGALQVAMLRSDNREVFGNDSAGLYDMSDGVALFEFRTRKQTLGFELVDSLQQAFDRVNKEFQGLVIGHDGDNFSYGANLMEAMQAWQEGDRERVVQAAKEFQETALRIRYTSFPVVVAAFGMTLGGGTEFMMHADKVVAHHELYCGLVEAGVGLLPAGGGTKEMLYRVMKEGTEDERYDPLPEIREVFKTIGMAKVSDSAENARALKYLRDIDDIVMNRDLLLSSAKEEVMTLAEVGYRPPIKPDIKVLGKTGLSALNLMLYIMHEGGFITDYDRIVAGKIAFVMSGGELSEPQKVPEEYLLKLEREAFLELLEDKRTHARIEHMLKKGKPLRN